MIAYLALFAPLLIQVYLSANSSALDQTLFAAISLWLSGVGVVGLFAAVFNTWLQARAGA